METHSETALTERVGAALRENDAMVAVAESATGGLIGSMLTDVSGSSDYFDCALVTYSNDAKMDLLGVDPETLTEHGAVSEPTAREMARGVCEVAGTEWGVATTGIAGPGGGTAEKPVGTIYIGVARASETPRVVAFEATLVSVERYEFDGTRLENKAQFAQQALADLLDALE